jgi:RNA polymerase-binding transcription factor DksA
MDKNQIETSWDTLNTKHRVLIQRRQAALAGEQELRTTPEADWEDAASNRSNAQVMATLAETEMMQIVRLQAAMDRIKAGTYGRCVGCGKSVERKRLKLMPETERCARCTTGDGAEGA